MKTHAWRAPSALLIAALLVGAACGAPTGEVTGASAEDADAGTAADPQDLATSPEDDPDGTGPSLDFAEQELAGLGSGPAIGVSTPGFDGETIVLGVMSPPEGSPDEQASASAAAGAAAYVAELNERGGVAGKHPVELHPVPVSEAGDERSAYEASRDDVLLYVHVPRGSAPRLREAFLADDVVGAPAATDARWLRTQNALAFATPDEMQVANGLDWALQEAGVPVEPLDEPAPGPRPDGATGATGRSGGSTSTSGAGDGQAEKSRSKAEAPEHTVCVVAGASDRAEAAVSAVRVVTRARGVDLGTVVAPPPPAADGRFPGIGDVITRLKKASCRTVVLATAPDRTVAVMRAASRGTYAPQWVALSWSWTPEIAEGQLARYAGKNLAVVGTGVVPWGTDDDGDAARRLRRARDAHAPDIVDGDLDFAFGYAQAMVAHQVIERAVAMGDLSRGGIINAINTIDLLQLGGLADDVAFGRPEQRRAPRASAVLGVDRDAPWGLRVLAEPQRSAATVAVSSELDIP